MVRIPTGGLIEARVRDNPSVGASVVVSIRPERVELREQPAESLDGSFPATISEIVYLGSHNQIVLYATPNMRLIVNVPTDQLARPGDSVVATVPSRYATCFIAE